MGEEGSAPASSAAEAFGRLYSIVARLRAPDGCPWDREQTPKSLRGSVVEEAYELVEAIDEGDAAHVPEEAGDLFLLATMIPYMHEEAGQFSVADSLTVMEIAMALEDRFQIAIPDDQAEKISTVGEAIAYIENNTK